MLRFSCEHCGAKIQGEDRYAGQQARCPKCHQLTKVPLPPAVLVAPKPLAVVPARPVPAPPPLPPEPDPQPRWRQEIIPASAREVDYYRDVPRRRSRWTIALAWMVLTAIPTAIASGVTWWILAQRDAPPSDAAAYRHGTELVREKLLTPASAKFPVDGVAKRREGQIGDGLIWEIESYVDTQNGFGAMLRGRYKAEIHYLPLNRQWRLNMLWLNDELTYVSPELEAFLKLLFDRDGDGNLDRPAVEGTSGKST